MLTHEAGQKPTTYEASPAPVGEPGFVAYIKPLLPARTVYICALAAFAAVQPNKPTRPPMGEPGLVKLSRLMLVVPATYTRGAQACMPERHVSWFYADVAAL